MVGLRAGRDRRLRERRASLLDRLLLLCSTSRYIDGLWIGAEDSSKSDLVLSRITDALCLIKTHDPYRFARILRDLDRVWVRVVPGANGRFNPPLRTCELNRRFVLDEASSAELIAATIVHEATHARLWHCGIGYEEEVRARVEYVCIRRELAFAAKLPNGQAVRARAKQKLSIPGNVWTDAYAQERRVRSRIQTLRDLGTPGWLLRALLALRVMHVTLTRGYAHPDRARSLDDLAGLHVAQGDLGRARREFERALAIREKTLGQGHADTARSLSYLGGVLQAQGDLAGARPLLERAFAIREKELGPEHPDTMKSLDDLARLHQSRGELGSARLFFERALAISEKVLGPEHSNTAAILINLAGLVQSQGDLAGARPLFERTLAIKEKVLGFEHPDIATSINYLADLLRAQGDLAGMRPLLERALAIDEKALGPDHPGTATDLSNLGGLLHEQGDFAAARPLLERALRIDEKALGPEHPDTAKSLSNLARLLNDAGHSNEAEPYLRKAITIADKAYGPSHPETQRYQSHYADLLLKTGRAAEALAIGGAALATHERSLGTNHPWTRASARVTVHALEALNRTEEAAALRARLPLVGQREMRETVSSAAGAGNGRLRFAVRLLIKHPSIHPAQITDRLGLSPNMTQLAGAPIETPAGTKVEGTYKESAWGWSSRRYGSRRFSEELKELLTKIEPHSEFLRTLTSSGGRVLVGLSLPGDINIGDEIGWTELESFVRLKAELGIEVFPNFN